MNYQLYRADPCAYNSTVIVTNVLTKEVDTYRTGTTYIYKNMNILYVLYILQICQRQKVTAVFRIYAVTTFMRHTAGTKRIYCAASLE